MRSPNDYGDVASDLMTDDEVEMTDFNYSIRHLSDYIVMKYDEMVEGVQIVDWELWAKKQFGPRLKESVYIPGLGWRFLIRGLDEGGS